MRKRSMLSPFLIHFVGRLFSGKSVMMTVKTK